jgi:hypothetical protein
MKALFKKLVYLVRSNMINQITVRQGDIYVSSPQNRCYESYILVAVSDEMISYVRKKTVHLNDSIYILAIRAYRIANGGKEDMRLQEIISDYTGNDEQVSPIS